MNSKIALSSMIIRGAAIALKFVSIALISRNLAVNSLDLYFLFIAVAAVASPLFGLQTFHIVLKQFNRDNDNAGLHSQYFIYAFMMIALLLVMLTFHDVIQTYTYGFFWLVYFLIISESLSTELARNLIIQNRNVLSNFVILLNSFFYVLFGVAIELKFMDAVINSWAPFIILNLVLCSALFIYTQRNLIDKEVLKKSIDFRSLVISASPYLLIQVLNVAIIYFSRFVLESTGHDGAVSSYSILFSIANVIGVFVTVSLIAPFSPKYMKYKGNDDGMLKKLYVSVLLFGGLSIVILQLIYGPLVDILGIPMLGSLRLEYLIILISILFMSLSQVYQLKFLKRNLDKVNLYSYISSFIITVVISLFFIPEYGVMGAAVSLFASSLSLFFIRTYFYFKVVD